MSLFLIDLDDDVNGPTSNNNKYDGAIQNPMNNTGINVVSNFFPQQHHPPSNSNTSLLVFENCGSASTIEELNFSVLHNVSHQNNLNSETRTILKR